MSVAQRISRGFHRLGPFLAAVPLLVVGTWSVFNALNAANNARLSHDEQAHLVCAKARIAATRKTTPGQPSVRLYSGEDDLSDDEQIDVQKLGCSDRAQTASFREVFNSKPDDFNYPTEFLPPLAIGLAITLGLTLFVYGLVRAIGWVIGGFAAS